MINRRLPHKLAESANWAARMALGLLLLAAPQLHAIESNRVSRTASSIAGSKTAITPRFAQRDTSRSSLSQVISPIIESLLPPKPDLPTQADPKQHVIPFNKPDPDANIAVEQNEGLISLKVRDASLRQVVAMVAETQQLNIVFAAPADIAITASFNSIPWQQALDALLSASGHTWTTNDGIIFVSSVETAEFMPPGSGGRLTRIFDLDFASAVDVDQTIKGLLSPGGQSWIQESSSDDNRRSREMVVVFDFPAHLERIAQYVCEADQAPRQVLIEAHILQVDLEEDCRNGINFEALASFHNNKLNFKTVGFANAAASPAFFLTVTGTALKGLVELLQTTTDAKTLASPRLFVISGQEARIQIGEKLGYRITTTTQTSSLESIEFLDVGVVLTVTPRVTRDGRVMMRIKPVVSTGRVGVITGLP
jgi:type IV pilus assembly protein PilQ